MCSGRGVLVAHTWQPRKENFLLSDAKRVAKAETPTALSLARWFLVTLGGFWLIGVQGIFCC